MVHDFVHPQYFGLGEITTHFRTYFSGWIESDVHWGNGVLTSGHRCPFRGAPAMGALSSRYFFGWEGCPTKIDDKKKLVPVVSPLKYGGPSFDGFLFSRI